MVAVACAPSAFGEPKVWLLRPYAQNNQVCWTGFFKALDGAPRHIVAKLDASIADAATTCFPRCSGPHVCEQGDNGNRGREYEALIKAKHKLTSELIGKRASRLQNRARIIKLLDLLTLGINGEADESAFADAIHRHLDYHYGRPLLHQRPHDDPKGNPSLFAS